MYYSCDVSQDRIVEETALEIHACFSIKAEKRESRPF